MRIPVFEKNQHAVIRVRIAEAVDARDAGHDDHIASLEPAARVADIRKRSMSSLTIASFSM
jgi:hypothetical protein